MGHQQRSQNWTDTKRCLAVSGILSAHMILRAGDFVKVLDREKFPEFRIMPKV